MTIDKSHFSHESLSLLTDLYELTMAYGYWKLGLHEREAAFHLFYRKPPFKGSYAIAAGLQTVIDYLDDLTFKNSDLEYLASLRAHDGSFLFEKAFLDYLSDFTFTCNLSAVPEGTPIFPNEPILQVTGPILQAQIIESALLNIINFQSLIATKSSRICLAAYPDEVVEFGLRRAQGIDGALSAARAAFIGGCKSSSNVLAGKYFDIPVKGTMAHSWVMAFDSEEEAFRSYAQAMPNNCLFLVDTYESVGGAERAIKIAKECEDEKTKLLGLRLDSGDLAELSIEVRKRLDAAGFTDAKIMASNELDEFIIRDLKHQGAEITLWGVGTNLITGSGQKALDGVYKLSAIKDDKGVWQHRLKISEQLVKITNPGILQVRRFEKNGTFLADMIYDEILGPSTQMVDPVNQMKLWEAADDSLSHDLLVPILLNGEQVYHSPSLRKMQQTAHEALRKFDPALRRFLNPPPYFVGLEKQLSEEKLALIVDSCK